jgi:hypothetical protein
MSWHCFEGRWYQLPGEVHLKMEILGENELEADCRDSDLPTDNLQTYCVASIERADELAEDFLLISPTDSFLSDDGFSRPSSDSFYLVPRPRY